MLSNRHNQDQADYIFQIPQDCVGSVIVDLQSQLQALLILFSDVQPDFDEQQKKIILLDGSDVQLIDVLGLQLFVWFQLKARQYNISYRVKCSSQMVSQARFFGLSSYFSVVSAEGV